jgi:hypothetical protein
VPKTHHEVCSFVQFWNLYAKFIHNFSDTSGPLTDLLKKSKPQLVVRTPTCMQAFEILNLRLIYAQCMVLPEVNWDATFTLASYGSSVGIAIVLLQYKGGRFQIISYMARKLNIAKRVNSHSAYDSETWLLVKPRNIGDGALKVVYGGRGPRHTAIYAHANKR